MFHRQTNNATPVTSSLVRTWVKVLALLLFVAGATTSLLAQIPGLPKEPYGIDNLDLVVGNGEGSDNFRIALQWDWFQRTTPNRQWTILASLAPNYSVFNGETRADGVTAKLRDVGLTPVFTLIPNKFAGGWATPYVEAGIGLHYLTEKNVGFKSFSTNFQFGDHIGIGAYFGRKNAYKVGYIFQHLSNGGIDAPNPGINFHMISMGFKLR